jgi:hypothetical protein
MPIAGNMLSTEILSYTRTNTVCEQESVQEKLCYVNK